jgi:hypothetical protein
MNYEKDPSIQSLSGHSKVFGLGEASNFGIGEQWALVNTQFSIPSAKA